MHLDEEVGGVAGLDHGALADVADNAGVHRRPAVQGVQKDWNVGANVIKVVKGPSPFYRPT
jgi:hypothetical protein